MAFRELSAAYLLPPPTSLKYLVAFKRLARPPDFTGITMKRLLSLLAVVALPAAGQTPEGRIDDEAAFLSDLPVVMTASRMSQSQHDAPGSVTVIDRDQIRASGAREVTEVLRLVPGFIATFAEGSYPVAAYHGLTRDRSNRMLVLIDGRSAYSPYLLGGIEWNQLGVDIDDIERIEVFRGSNSATYGSNAVLGVVSIVTRSAHDSPTATVSIQRGPDGVRDSSIATTLKEDRISMRLRAREQRDDGFEGFFDGRRLRMVDVRADYRIDTRSNVEMHAGGNHAFVGRGYPVEGSEGDPPRWGQTGLQYVLVRLGHAEDTENEWALTYYHQSERAKDQFTQTAYAHNSLYNALRRRGMSANAAAATARAILASYGLPDVFGVDIDFNFATRREDVEFVHSLRASKQLRLTWGLGVRRDVLDSATSLGRANPSTTEQAQISGNLEWAATSSLLFNAGALVEKSSLSGTHTAPRLAVNYHLDGRQTVRMAWSRAYRAPTAFEEMSDSAFAYNNVVLRQTYKPAGSLLPERIEAMEMGYVGEWRNKSIQTDVRVFRERIKDMIKSIRVPLSPSEQLDPSNTYALSFRNGGWADTTGVETQIVWRPDTTTRLSLAYTVMNIRSDEEKSLASAPHQVLVLGASRRILPSVDLALTHYRYGRMNWQQSSDQDLQPYHRTDVRLSYQLPSKAGQLEVFMLGQHVGHSNSEYRPTYKAEQRWIAGLAWAY